MTVRNDDMRYFCSMCGKKFHRSILTKEHIIPSSRGGCHKGWNLTMSCAPCNHSRGNHTWETPKYSSTSGNKLTPTEIKRMMKIAARLPKNKRQIINGATDEAS